jgi:hypothetical protein
MTSTSLIPQSALEDLAATGQITLAELMDALAAFQVEGKAPREEPAAQPVKISISDEQRILMRRLAVQLAELSLPDSPRMLSPEERQEFIRVFADVKSAKDAVGTAEEALRETFANHLDVEARARAGKGAKFPLDSHGHVLARGEVRGEGLAVKVTRELRGGKAAPLSMADLNRLEREGKIDHATFLRMTEAVPATRRVDEAKIMDLLAKKPELVKVLAEVATLTDKTASVYLRKV